MNLDAIDVMREVHRHGYYLLAESHTQHGVQVQTIYIRAIDLAAPRPDATLLARVQEHASELYEILGRMQ
jgi:hypothetical protein